MSICGVGDALALFRYMCCRRRLYPTLSLGGQLSAVGEVFSSGEVSLGVVPHLNHSPWFYRGLLFS